MFPPHIRRMARPPKPYVPFAEPVAYRIIAGLASGRGLRAICRGADMPTRPTVMRWLKERPGFAHDVAAARAYGGLDRPGRPSLYGEALMEAIYMRLCAGEPLRTICRDPRMPGRSTVQGWAKHRAKAARLLALGHDVGRHMAAERQWLAWGEDN